MKSLIILLILSSTCSWSQDYGADMRKILTNFSKLESYSIKASISASGKDGYNFTASIKNSKYGIHTKIGQSEMLMNYNYGIAIDHSDKTIRVSKGDFKTKNKGSDDLGLDALEESINENTRFEYLGATEKYKTYVIYQDGVIEKTIVKISKQTGFFYEIQVVYKSDDITIDGYKVRYTEFKKNPRYKKSDFNESKVIIKSSEGKITPVAKYKGYTIIIEE